MQENYTFLDDLGEELDLLQRHIKILQLLKKDGPMGILRISQITNIPQHRVRYSLRILETEGMIAASPEGAKIVGNVDDFVKKLKNGLSEIEKRISELRKDLDSF